MRRPLPAQQAAQSDHQHSRSAPGSVDTAALDDGVYGGTPTSVDEGDSGAAGTAATVSRSDHQHAFNPTLVPVGGVVLWTTNTAPTDWLLCDGTAVSRTTYAGLFAVIGTTYGVGDGSTTFNLPNVQQRFPLGKATAGTGSTLGGTGGAIDHVHNLDTASSHSKWVWGTGDPEVFLRRKAVTSYTSTHAVGNTVAGSLPNAATHAASVAVGVELAGDSDTANPPFVVFNFIIRAA